MAPDRLLHADRERTLARLASLRSDHARVVAASEGSNDDDEHDPEGQTIAFERSQLATLVRQAERHLAEIDAALHRVAGGSFGRCEACGRPIGEGRLGARPTARLCIRCASG